MSDDHSKHHIVQPSTYAAILGALLVFTVLTYYVAFIDLGVLSNFVAMGIAVTKGALVVLFFMHIFYSTRLLWVVVVGSFGWLALMLILTLGDYVTRHWDIQQRIFF
ncbi:MAG: cytochrome C oxidase subunit IV family protein [Acidobacteria bacterium]|nr:cytochrome C oxidase subunit IV family protein [Acidobacteriota bacterium]